MLKTGLSSLSNIMHGKQDITELTESVITFLTKYMDLPLAAFFVKDSNGFFVRVADFGYLQKEKLQSKFESGSGIIGQAAFNMEPITITDIPEYARYAFGFGQMLPAVVLVNPLVYNDQTIGVLELCSLNEFTKDQMDWLKQASSSITLALQSVLVISELKKTMYIEWDEEYDVHVKEINEQHLQTFSLLNTLFDAIIKGQKIQVMKNMFDNLLDDGVEHFSYEEDLMSEHDYPDFEVHQNEHKMLVAEMNKINSQMLTENKALTMDIIVYLANLLKSHITKSDKPFTDYLNKQGY